MRILLDAGTTSITLDRFDGYPPRIHEEGVDVILASGHPLGDAAGRKALPYTALLDARREAAEVGAFDVIFLDADGAVLEGSASNLFAVVDGTILTPPVTRPILPGITRAEVLEAAAAAGIAAREQDLRPGDLITAEEAFLTGSLMEIVPIRAVDGTPLPLGPVAPRLREDLFGN
jgi:branched-subunit amino acid aminotransferase/4-amino-4-deoxychorismate lyase